MKECVGCGYCCMKSPCMVCVCEYGLVVRECPALYWNGEMYRCRLIEEDAKYAAALAVGAGCCSSLNTWRRDVRLREPSEAHGKEAANNASAMPSQLRLTGDHTVHDE